MVGPIKPDEAPPNPFEALAPAIAPPAEEDTPTGDTDPEGDATHEDQPEMSGEDLAELIVVIEGMFISRAYPEAPLTVDETEVLKRGWVEFSKLGLPTLPPWATALIALGGTHVAVLAPRMLAGAADAVEVLDDRGEVIG